MLLGMKQERRARSCPANEARRPCGWLLRVAVWGMVFGGLALTFQVSSQTPDSKQTRQAGAQPDAQVQIAMNDQRGKKANVENTSLERKRQITDDSARLLKLATDLKTAVDKTSKDTLSLNVIRKAEEIERLAKSVKDKMKLTMNASN
jgi:hypothetical protein